MVAASIAFRVRGDKRSEVVSTVDALVQRMRHASGCLCSRLLADVDDPNLLMLSTEWADYQSASAYFDSHEFHVFRGLKILLRDEPYIVIDDISGRVTKTLRGH